MINEYRLILEKICSIEGSQDLWVVPYKNKGCEDLKVTIYNENGINNMPYSARRQDTPFFYSETKAKYNVAYRLDYDVSEDGLNLVSVKYRGIIHNGMNFDEEDCYKGISPIQLPNKR